MNGLCHVVIGNAPCGYRAWLALAFINHAAAFADWVGTILPMSIQSDGKGNPAKVNALRQAGSELRRSTLRLRVRSGHQEGKKENRRPVAGRGLASLYVIWPPITAVISVCITSAAY